MKKFLLLVPIFLLIIFTTITKKSTKKIDREIFLIKENIRILEDKYELVLLDFNYLTSPKKLMEYQHLYFENQIFQKDIHDLNWIKIENNEIKIGKMVINEW